MIALTEDLVASAGAADAPAQPTPEAEAPSAPPAAPPPPPPPPIAASVAGAPCQARYDGTWYEAVMEEVLADGRVRVRFPAYGTVADVGPDDLREASEVGAGAGAGAATGAATEAVNGAATDAGEEDAREVYRGVPAPKRVRVTGDATEFRPKEVPKKLHILDEDDDATRERKRKQIKAFKSKERLREMDAEQNAKKSSWQSFQAKVGGKKKTGFMSKKLGAKKESIFSTGAER